jgi:hypothetical protein
VSVLLSACGSGGSSPSGAGGSSAGGAGGTTVGTGGGGTAGSSGATGTGGSGTGGGPSTPSGIGRLANCALALNGACVRTIDRTSTDVCARWKQDFPLTTFAPGWWTPPAQACGAGQLATGAVTDVLRRLSLYRWLAHLSPATMGTPFAAETTQCAVVTAYGDRTNVHNPAPGSPCYSDGAALGAGGSDIQTARWLPAVALERFIFDMGDTNSGELGHRTSLLAAGGLSIDVGYSQKLGSTQFIEGATCVLPALNYEDPVAPLDHAVAFPSDGVFPLEATQRSQFPDAPLPLQWSFTVDGVDFANASAKLYAPGPAGPVQQTIASGRLSGLSAGIWMQLDADPAAGTYYVEVSGTDLGDIGYRVDLVDCGAAIPATCDPVNQDCGKDWLGCYRIDSAPFCSYVGPTADGAACSSEISCQRGLTCYGDTLTCRRYCGRTGTGARSCSTLCPNTTTPLPLAGVGVCL